MSALLPPPCAAVPSSDSVLDCGDSAESDDNVSHINNFIVEDNDDDPPGNDGDPIAVDGAVTVVVPENELSEGGSLEAAVMEEAAKSAVRGEGAAGQSGGGLVPVLKQTWGHALAPAGSRAARQAEAQGSAGHGGRSAR